MKKNSNPLKKLEADGFRKVCSVSDLKERVGKRFIIEDIEVAVFKVDSEIFALNNICPHKQTHLIYDGFIEDESVICPAHGWSFNLRTGRKPSGSRGLDTYPVKIINNDVYIKALPKKMRW